MSFFISPEKISEIQRSFNLLDLVSNYISLSRGGVNYVGLCPFHREKTPSFTVNVEKQLYKCFGCGESGTIFNFFMKQEGLSFPEAVKTLAERASIPLTNYQQENPQRTEVLYEANEQATRFFSNLLLKTQEGKRAKEYLSSRLINDNSISTFRLGYSLDRWDSLVHKSREWNTNTQILEKAGLILKKKSGGFYDRFRNRLMFPIFDMQNKSVGFGARTLDDSSSAKYLNSPETAIFHKSKTLFGINLAKSSINKKRKILIMEGYTDVIMAHQCGIDWSVALLGTALTRDHVKILKRYCDKATLALDADNAGQRSSERSLDTFIEEDFDVRVVLLPENYDPYDFLVKRGAEQLLKLEEKAYDFLGFKIALSKNKWDISSVSGRLSAINDILASAAKIPNILKRELTIKRIAEEMSLDENILRTHLVNFQSAQKSKITRSVSSNEPLDTLNKLKSDAYHTIETTLLGLMISRNDLIKKVETDIGFESFNNSTLRNIAIHISEIYSQKGEVDLNDISSLLQANELFENVVSIFLKLV